MLIEMVDIENGDTNEIFCCWNIWDSVYHVVRRLSFCLGHTMIWWRQFKMKKEEEENEEKTLKFVIFICYVCVVSMYSVAIMLTNT